MGSEEDPGPKLLCVVNLFTSIILSTFEPREEKSAQCPDKLWGSALTTSKTETDTTVCQQQVQDETLGTRVDKAIYNP